MFQISLHLRERLLGRSTFTDDEVRIGRSADNEICIDNPALSRYHAAIETVDSLQILRDFSSQNGTSVNGERVTGRRALNAGDRIAIGKFVLVYRPDRVATAKKPTVRDEASFAVAGRTMVLNAMTATTDARERACPIVGYLEAPGAPPQVHALVRDVTFVGSAAECAIAMPQPAPPRAFAILRGWRGFAIVALATGVKRGAQAVEAFANLHNGDVISIGKQALHFRVGRPETA